MISIRCAFRSACFALLVAGSVAGVGCGNGGPEARVLGTYQGGFIPDAKDATATGILSLPRYRTRGYVKLILDKHRYIMELNGEQQQINIKGKWRFENRSVILDPSDVEVITRGGQKNFDPNRAYLPEPDLNFSYGKKMVMRHNPKTKSLSGIVMTIAGYQGQHTFKME